MQYNYVTSAAMDVGLALCALAIFFFVQMPGGVMPDWWGVTVVENTLDYAGAAVKKTVTGVGDDVFGPPRGSWKW